MCLGSVLKSVLNITFPGNHYLRFSDAIGPDGTLSLRDRRGSEAEASLLAIGLSLEQRGSHAYKAKSSTIQYFHAVCTFGFKTRKLAPISQVQAYGLPGYDENNLLYSEGCRVYNVLIWALKTEILVELHSSLATSNRYHLGG